MGSRLSTTGVHLTQPGAASPDCRNVDRPGPQHATTEERAGPWRCPVDQVIRERQFLAANPQWQIFSKDRGSRFIAECNDPNRVIVGLSLRELLDRLEQIVGADE